MEISYKRDGSQNFMIIKEQEINENDYKLQMVINNNIQGIIPLSIKTINNKPEIYYGITSMISMESMYAKKQMSGRDIYNLVKSIKNLSDNMKEYLLDINNILFGMEFVYLKRQEEKYRFCYCPENSVDSQESLRVFFDKLLEYINHNDRRAVLIAYGIQQITISDGFTIQDLVDCAEKIIKKSEPEYSSSCENGQNLSNLKQKDLNEIKTDKTKPERNNPLKKFLGMFKGKNRYKDEDELLWGEENEKLIEKEELSLKECIAENFSGDMEDATMLLTSAGTLETITLRSIDLEETMEITPNKFPCVLGKSRKSSDFYVDSPVVSRVHMRILEDMTGYFVEDLNSTNGTFVNGEQLIPHELKEINVGDQITLANIDFIVE
ncbi:MAG: DUF6382 domain-containing protein [Eubacterium sp.]